MHKFKYLIVLPDGLACGGTIFATSAEAASDDITAQMDLPPDPIAWSSITVEPVQS